MNQRPGVKFLSKKLSFLLALSLLATGVMACGEETEAEANQEQNQNQNQGSEEGIEIAGTWETNFQTEEIIDEQSWGFMILIDYDNDERWAITQNPSDDEYNPDAFMRLVWTPLEEDEFYYCMVEFGLETEEEARNSTATADAEDLDGEGCNGFSWTKMTRK